MASEVDVCNRALIAIGASTIVSLTEGSTNANACNQVVAEVRDELLREYQPNFAIARQKLAQLAAEPDFEWAHAYQLPSDCLRIVSVHDNDAGQGAVGYRVEGRRLMCDADEVYLRYVRQVTDPNQMDTLFRRAWAYAIALEIADKIAASQSKVERVAELAESYRRRARGVDAQEDFPPAWPAGSWTAER